MAGSRYSLAATGNDANACGHSPTIGPPAFQLLAERSWLTVTAGGNLAGTKAYYDATHWSLSEAGALHEIGPLTGFPAEHVSPYYNTAVSPH